MKRMKLSEAELIALIINMQRELEVALEMLPKKSAEVENLKDQLMSSFTKLLKDGYKVSAKDNLYDAVFSGKQEKVKNT